MVEITSYLEDGANWQAQAVLAFLRNQKQIITDNIYGTKLYDTVEIKAGRFENDREQGYVVSVSINYEQRVNYAFFEHRNSDRIVVFKFYGLYINTPTWQSVYAVGTDHELSKSDYDKSFDYGDIVGCGEWISDDIVKELLAYGEEHQELMEKKV